MARGLEQKPQSAFKLPLENISAVCVTGVIQSLLLLVFTHEQVDAFFAL